MILDEAEIKKNREKFVLSNLIQFFQSVGPYKINDAFQNLQGIRINLEAQRN